MKMRKAVGMVSIILLSGILTFTVMNDLPDFGSFPDREIGNVFKDSAIGQKILERAFDEVGGANVVTDVLWDYRGYDSLGEATVLFSAATGIAALSKIKS